MPAHRLASHTMTDHAAQESGHLQAGYVKVLPFADRINPGPDAGGKITPGCFVPEPHSEQLTALLSVAPAFHTESFPQGAVPGADDAVCK